MNRLLAMIISSSSIFVILLVFIFTGVMAFLPGNLLQAIPLLRGSLLFFAKNNRMLFVILFFLISFLLPTLLIHNVKRIKGLLEDLFNLRVLAATFYSLCVVSSVGVVTWKLQLNTSVIIAGSIGAFVPAIYYVYLEIVKRPTVDIGDLDFESDTNIAPLYFRGIPNIARPAIFVSLNFTNTGNATAKNCAIKVRLERMERNTGKYIDYYGRWSIPSNDERYDLLPGETQKVHLLKIFLTKDFFLIKRYEPEIKARLAKVFDKNNFRNIPSKYFNEMQYHSLNNPKSPAGKLKFKSPTDQFKGIKLQTKHITNQFCIYRPARKPPHRRSTRGGWEGDEINNPGEFKLFVQPIAGNYKKSEEQVRVEGGDAIDLTLTNLANEILEGRIKWQEQWEEETEEGSESIQFKQKVSSSLREIVK